MTGHGVATTADPTMKQQEEEWPAKGCLRDEVGWRERARRWQEQKGAEEEGEPFIYGYLCVFACVTGNQTRVGIGGEVGVRGTKAVGNGGATRTMSV